MNKSLNWALFEKYNALDARLRPNALAQLGVQVKSEEIKKILTKSHFVIPGKTRYACQQCGECCRYARKVANLTYEPCVNLTEDNRCEIHDDRYLVCKWFPFFVYDDPSLGPLLTIKPYCSGYGKGKLVDYDGTVKRLKALEQKATRRDDGAFVIHEVLYLEQNKEWAFPSKQNIDTLLQNIRKKTGNGNGAAPENLKKTELAHAQKYTNRLLGGIDEPQATLDEQGRITDLNPPFAALCNSSRSALIDKRLDSLFVDEDQVSKLLQLCFSTGRLNAQPERLKMPGGVSLNVLLNGVTFRSRRDGQVHGLLVSVKKIDKRVYEELLHSRDYARGLIEASLDLMVFLDRDGMILDVNQACCEMVSRKRGEIIGTRFCSYFTEPDRARGGINQCYEQGKVRNYVLQLKNDAGVPVSFNASLYEDSTGVIRGIVATARPVDS